MANDGPSPTAGGTLYLIFIQIVSRGLTFVANQALLRYVQPGHLGLAVQLEALSISILYTSRESLRVALQRSPLTASSTKPSTDRATQVQLAVNAAYVVVALGICIDIALTLSYLASTNTSTLRSTHFTTAFRLYNVATILELLSEPCFIVIQQHSQVQSRARAETSAAIAKCLISCLAAVSMHKSNAPTSVLPFAAGQLAYGTTLLLVYVASAWQVDSLEHFSLLPKPVAEGPEVIFSRFSRSTMALAGAFYGQSIFKWLLTQGDVLVLSIFESLQSQGIFALASNYGGLVSRLFFQPIEESSRAKFGALLSIAPPTSKSPVKSPRLSPEIVQKREKALDYLSSVLRAYSIMIVIPCFTLVPKVFPLFIQTLLGSRSQWNTSQTASLLSAYSYYIPFLAINGILDAFVSSTATEAELGAQSLMMVGVTMIYLSAAYFSMNILNLGATGLVYANILNMSLRIAFSVWFLQIWMQNNLPEIKSSSSKPSPFRAFVIDCLPSLGCALTVLPTIVALQLQTIIKASLTGNSMVTALMNIKLPRIEIDAFDLNYLFTAGVLVASSILLHEREFIARSLIPLLPSRIKQRLYSFLPHQQAKATG